MKTLALVLTLGFGATYFSSSPCSLIMQVCTPFSNTVTYQCGAQSFTFDLPWPCEPK